MIKRIIITVLVVALAITLFAVFISSTKQTNPIQQPVAEGSASLLESETVYQEEFSATDVENIGELPAGTIEYANDCGSETCFQEKFATCEPARIEISYEALGGAYEYIIEGSNETGCVITSQFLEHISDEWIDKTMTCVYDNTLPLDQASESLFLAGFPENGCTGPLADLFAGYNL